MFNVPNKLAGLLLSLVVPTLLWMAYNNTVNPKYVELFLYIWYSILLLAGAYCLYAAYYGDVKREAGRNLGRSLELTPLYNIVIQTFNIYFLFMLYGPVLPIMFVIGIRMINDSFKYVQFRTIRQLTKPAQRNIN